MSNLNLKTQNFLNKSQQKQLLKIARNTLEKYLKDKKVPQYIITDEALKKPLGVFVTLTKNNQLRGCIGEFNPRKPLYQTVQEKVVDSALHDPRFNLVTLEELEDINIEISVLAPKKKISDWRKIKLGQDGVLLKQGFRQATFLPQVAIETGWDLKTFLSNLCLYKAQLPSDCYQNPKTEIFVYQVQVFQENND